jgi:hypothetical protein
MAKRAPKIIYPSLPNLARLALGASQFPRSSSTGHRKIVTIVFAQWRIDSVKIAVGVLFLACHVIGPLRPIHAADSKASWQSEWNQTVRAAEQEGQVMVSIGGYGAIIDSGVFQKTYPKIKITHITGAGTVTQRISAERRAGNILSTFTTAVEIRCFRFFIRARCSTRSSRR